VYLSIKTKFIILLSILMAGILSIQFYFTQQTQNDIIEELTEMSSKINQATDIDFFEDANIHTGKVLAEQMVDKHKIPRWYFRSNLDSLIKSAENNFKRSSGETLYHYKQRKLDDEVHVEVIKRGLKFNQSDLLVLAKDPQPLPDKRLLFTDNDSANFYISEIEVDLNPVKDNNRSKLSYTLPKRKRIKKSDEPPSFTFVVPDFSEPQKPRILRFNYSIADIHAALDQIRNKNILTSWMAIYRFLRDFIFFKRVHADETAYVR